MLLKVLKMPHRRLDRRVIDDLCDFFEGRILEKNRVDIISEMALMKSDMINKIKCALGGIPRQVGSEDSYEEAIEDFESARPRGGLISWLNLDLS